MVSKKLLATAALAGLFAANVAFAEEHKDASKEMPKDAMKTECKDKADCHAEGAKPAGK